MAFTAKTRKQLVYSVIRKLVDFGDEDKLGGALDNSSTSLTATDTKQYTLGAILEIDQECIKLTEKASSTAITNVQRGARGTTAATHSSGELIRFNPKYWQEEIIELINTCLETELQQQKTTDASTTSVVNTYLYDLPTGITKENLRAVFLRSSTTDSTAETEGQITWYRINEGQGTAGVDQIEFRYAPTPSRYIKFVYRPGFTYLETDAATCDLPLNAAAHSLPALYACAHLLPAGDTGRLRHDSNTYEDGSTPLTARGRTGNWYLEEFKRIRRKESLEPNRTTTRTVGW